MSSSPTQIANRALSELPSSRISSIGANEKNALECALQYGPALAELLEAGEWSFATKRVVLTQLVTNDRDGIWLYAYELPDDMQIPLRMVEAPRGYAPTLLPGQTLAPLFRNEAVSLPYDLSGSTFYANTEGVVLEYIVRDPSVSGWSALFEKALVWKLAALICMPIRQDRTLREKLEVESHYHMQRALAMDLNKNANRYGDTFTPDVIDYVDGGDY